MISHYNAWSTTDQQIPFAACASPTFNVNFAPHFLILGIDLQNKGNLVYRLLDCPR